MMRSTRLRWILGGSFFLVLTGVIMVTSADPINGAPSPVPTGTDTGKNTQKSVDGDPNKPTKTTPAARKAEKPASPAKDAPNSGKSPGFMRRLEKKVDEYAGKAVGAIASVFFYELGSNRFERTLPGEVTDRKEIDRLVEAARKAGYDIHEVDLKLSLPPGANKEEQRRKEEAAKKLQKELSRKYTTGRTRTFKVEVRKPSENDSGKTVFTVTRHGAPIVVVWLVLGAVFFTLRMGFINFRAFRHAVQVTAGKYDNPEDKGEVNHFQALTAALSATVGLGNIAGVAIAVMVGGPGATFWMIVAGLLGMSSKFTECTLGQRYREVRPDGRIMGGAMFYLSKGLAELKLVRLGKVLGVLFAVLCVFASLGGGNAFQVSQSMRAVEQTIPALKDYHWLYGLVMAVMVGVVIIGGIRRIAATAEKIVPLMCGVYVLACLWILLINLTEIPAAFATIFAGAFRPEAGYGAFLGVLIVGFQRAAFSNEAGVGSAAIAHSAAKTEYPVREGIVALLEPFIDTVVVCTMTALVIVITGAYNNPRYASFVAANNGAALTSSAMKEQISWFPYVLSVAVILFAYSTMISWSYYGERCWAYLFGDRASMIYRIIFVLFVMLGSIMSATNVLDLSDLMILGMAFPNILGVVLLSGVVKRELDEYWKKLKAGELEVTRKT